MEEKREAFPAPHAENETTFVLKVFPHPVL
jgi:hypothetical protein